MHPKASSAHSPGKSTNGSIPIPSDLKLPQIVSHNPLCLTKMVDFDCVSTFLKKTFPPSSFDLQSTISRISPSQPLRRMMMVMMIAATLRTANEAPSSFGMGCPYEFCGAPFFRVMRPLDFATGWVVIVELRFLSTI